MLCLCSFPGPKLFQLQGLSSPLYTCTLITQIPPLCCLSDGIAANNSWFLDGELTLMSYKGSVGQSRKNNHLSPCNLSLAAAASLQQQATDPTYYTHPRCHLAFKWHFSVAANSLHLIIASCCCVLSSSWLLILFYE